MSITINYVDDFCGVFIDQITGDEIHNVCKAGYSCVLYLDVDETVASRCRELKKALGETCSNSFDQCVAGVECLENEYQTLTCGGMSFWSGNLYSINTWTKVDFDVDIVLLAVGIILLTIWFTIFIIMLLEHRRGLTAVAKTIDY